MIDHPNIANDLSFKSSKDDKSSIKSGKEQLNLFGNYQFRKFLIDQIGLIDEDSDY